MGCLVRKAVLSKFKTSQGNMAILTKPRLCFYWPRFTSSHCQAPVLVLSAFYSHLASLSDRRVANRTSCPPPHSKTPFPRQENPIQNPKPSSKFKTQFESNTNVDIDSKSYALLIADSHGAQRTSEHVCIYFCPAPGCIYTLEKRMKNLTSSK